MSNMISVASGFQYSVNIGYDLASDDKLRIFIPTKSALALLEEILISTRMDSKERARVLVGAYGKGKSHIILTILSVLMKRDRNLFVKLNQKLAEYPVLSQLIDNYYESNQKILPVVINGSSTSLSQAFLMSLQRTLSENDLLDCMPETNYQAAITTISRWKDLFPDTYKKFIDTIDEPVDEFLDKLKDYNPEAYDLFVAIYPQLTSGSVFSPFLGFDIIELYESAVRGIKNRGYSGIYVVYDEFSKYLEANITKASVSDIKMLQDFAEKCNRSGSDELHIMLISHKEISNYIDKLPKQKVDGWRGVSERFRHIHMSENFSQTYEIISTVIEKRDGWQEFCDHFANGFEGLAQIYGKQPLFNELSRDELNEILYGCFPLHPVSTFVLPRLSEKIAQNERTLFTFLSSQGQYTLSAFLSTFNDDKFTLITPDLIYDYFMPLLQKEVYDNDIHHTFILTSNILNSLPEGSLESKIIKTISLIYILSQFERLKPTSGELVNIYRTSYSPEEVNSAIRSLIDQKFLLYLKRSNDYLQLKQSSGVNIKERIHDTVEQQRLHLSVKDILNRTNFDNYMYPSRYNDEREMIRYFAFEYIDGQEITEDINWIIKAENIEADGVVFGILPGAEEEIARIKNIVKKTSVGVRHIIFLLPKHYQDIESVVREYNAVLTLREEAGASDPVLFDEYQVVVDDLQTVIYDFIDGYTRPETHRSTYIFNGIEREINRKANLTALMSDICDDLYGETPIINNEVINKNDITSTTNTSRSKLLAALLRSDLEPSLGLSGNGQEVSIMRSTLIRTGILIDGARPELTVTPQTADPENDRRVAAMLSTINEFFIGAEHTEAQRFDKLYEKLESNSLGIGLRRGLIPIYIAVILHIHKKDIVLSDRFGQVSPSADLLAQINAAPGDYSAAYIDWSPEKERYVRELSNTFSPYVIELEKALSPFDFVATAIRRWYLDLPRFSREAKKNPNGGKIHKRKLSAIRAIKGNSGSYELLFSELPEAFEENVSEDLCQDIADFKHEYDELLSRLKAIAIAKTKELFAPNGNSRASLKTILSDWLETLDAHATEQLFADGAHRMLGLLQTVTNDELSFIERLCKTVTDLSIDDWDDSTIDQYAKRLAAWKKTAEDFYTEEKLETVGTSSEMTSDYQITFPGTNGEAVIKRFNKITYSPRGKLLYNSITSSLASMGQALSEQEKRQILMEILEKLC